MKNAADFAAESGVAALLESGAAPALADTLFRNTVDHAPVGIAFADRDGSYCHCNRAFCAMLGYSVDELTARSITSITLPEDLAATAEGLERLWSGDIAHLDVEKRYRRRDGSALWVRVTTSLVDGGRATVPCTVEFLRDISARKEIAAVLVQNQTLLSTLIAELPLALLACDVDGRVTHHNRAAVELFGITDWLTEQEHEEPALQQYDQSILGDPVKDRKSYEDASPIKYFKNAKAPLLILQGANDIRDPKEEAEQAETILKKEGKVVDAHYYPDEGHGFAKRENQIDAMQRTVDWFDRYLKTRH